MSVTKAEPVGSGGTGSRSRELAGGAEGLTLRSRARSEAASGVVTLLLGCTIAFEARRLPDPEVDVLGPSAFPFVLGLVIALCGVAMLVGALWPGRHPETAASAAAPAPARWGVLGVTLLLLVLYTQGIAWLGFPLVTALFTASFLPLLGERGAVRIAITSVAIAAVVYAVFGLLLGVDLPMGKLFGH